MTVVPGHVGRPAAPGQGRRLVLAGRGPGARIWGLGGPGAEAVKEEEALQEKRGGCGRLSSWQRGALRPGRARGSP